MTNEHISAETFAIGEIAIYWRPDSPLSGMEVTIASNLHDERARDHVTGERRTVVGYAVLELGPRGRRWVIEPHNLRKKRPPREDLQVTRWDQCPWQPAWVRA